MLKSSIGIPTLSILGTRKKLKSGEGFDEATMGK